jgi:alkanesulfonate monooxygenase SsuD/methylene tetrahydromethanopterin reductase-like flavin-dependent oxidoreductase (luciferase family)
MRGAAASGTPAQLREQLRGYEKAGIEQVIFLCGSPFQRNAAIPATGTPEAYGLRAPIS